MPAEQNWRTVKGMNLAERPELLLALYLVPVACVGLLIWAGHWLVTRKDPPVKPFGDTGPNYTPRQKLDRRLARGEISAETYRIERKNLGE